MDNYELFIDIIKHSQARNTTFSDFERKAFAENYVLNSTLFQNLTISKTYLVDSRKSPYSHVQ